jgi:hypothetical protein
MLSNLHCTPLICYLMTFVFNVSEYAAQNVTVNVTIPPSTGTISLMSVNGWLTILSRIDSTFPLRQNWVKYKTGFGDVTSNFWLGLERIFQLTNIATNGGVMYRLRFELQSNDTHR